jgi:hypothetical protein
MRREPRDQKKKKKRYLTTVGLTHVQNEHKLPDRPPIQKGLLKNGNASREAKSSGKEADDTAAEEDHPQHPVFVGAGLSSTTGPLRVPNKQKKKKKKEEDSTSKLQTAAAGGHTGAIIPVRVRGCSGIHLAC